MPTDRVHRLPQQAQPRTLPPHRPQPAASDAATRPRHAHPGSEREALHPLRRAAPDPSRCTRYVALHPLRRNAPDQKGCNAYGSGAPPPTTSTTAGNSSPQTPTVHLGRCDTASTCSRRFRARAAAPVTSRCTRYVAAHPLRRDTPDQKGCNAYGSGAPPPATSQTAGISSRHTQAAASDAATQPRNTRPAPYKRRYTRSVALHPLRRDTPDQKGCNAYGSGAPPLSNKPN